VDSLVEVGVAEQVRRPSRGELVASAAVSVGVTIIAGCVATFLSDSRPSGSTSR
jgi:hypothetical protein